MQLTDQVELLIHYCEEFDQGRAVFAKPIATVLRVLLHTAARGNTRGLVDQLGFRRGKWRSVAELGHPRDKQLPCPLVAVNVSMTVGKAGHSATCVPRLKRVSEGVRSVPFPIWWTEPIAYNRKNGKVFSRMDIVRSVTDTDGGAHVDASLDESYLSLRDGEFLGIRAVVAPNLVGLSFSYDKGFPIPGAVGAAIRSIAHETLLTLQDFEVEVFSQPYIWPTSI